ncbi:DUF6681 family protein [Latilactobacillus graminis]|uniref:Uncharacterized protein n=2 Tax=Latilactobacillus graminis TaxID=60519 RepID=A0AA89I132_9LACO|nr:DUF6681 family protein [Latilactobacillus graminis]KRM23367.1 hypothetical protein FC90_GL000321 [Latilactobacillus graminis DSM 20719]QFP80282.1 hypothetical protein LG542_08675 [Latilactobacillus graminis]
MLSFLDIINHYFGYLNINGRVKNRIFSIICLIGDFYLLYKSVTYFKAQAIGRGVVNLLVFLILLYFAVMNLYFYYRGKNASVDISPYVEKALGGDPTSPRPLTGTNTKTQVISQIQPATGLFEEQKLLPAQLVMTTDQSQHLATLVDELVATGYLSLNYAGLSDHDIYAQAQQLQQPIYAIGNKVALPFYELKQTANQWVIYGGMNAIDKQALAQVTTVGLTPIEDLVQNYQLAVAHTWISGGPKKMAGRNGVVEGQEPYQLIVQMAYQERTK